MKHTPRIEAVCISEKRGTAKQNVGKTELIENFGLSRDAHAGNWHRQVSLLQKEQIDAFNACGAGVAYGAFGENLVVSGITLSNLPVGTRLLIGQTALLEVTQIGKECHNGCEIFKRMGRCIMPTNGIFAKVITAGTVEVGDSVKIIWRAAVITASDRSFAGEREDKSGAEAESLLSQNGFSVVKRMLLPDDIDALSGAMREICDREEAQLIITTGGTGFSLRDITPEATLSIAERSAPGIAEEMRRVSMQYTDRGMLSRGVSVLRKKTLIINLPGSPKAVKESLSAVIGALPHGISMLCGATGNCAG